MLPAPSRLPQPWAANLGRSRFLFGEFGHEQDDPKRFYTAVAQDAVGHTGHYCDLNGAVMLDVGGGPGYFRDAFMNAGATYFALDADVGELSGQGEIARGTVVGDGMNLPFADGAFDLCYSSNVLEHVSDPWQMADEMLRVTKPGGIAYISYTLWYGPHGGHETAPWHFLGGHRARARYLREHGREPKNKFGESLFAVTAKQGLDWAKRQQAGDVLDLVPRYHPSWAYWLMRVPVAREVLSWNLAMVLRKR
ncbi:MAG: class I SAM-dependent methyltransferase [Marmoricola sp.]